MTKRRQRNKAPSGPNEALGRGLVNKAKQTTAGTAYNRPKPEPPMESRIQETDMEEFLNNAELANATFEAEKCDVKLITSTGTSVLRENLAETRSLEELSAQYGHLLKIPRRPKPGTYQSAEELEQLESEQFLDWRRQLAVLSEGSGLVITPFERNLEIWRQLWRVVERSHVVVQVVDARNPLLFRSADLERFVCEVDPRKRNLLLVNKADLLTPEQIRGWAHFFKLHNVEAIFWSAKPLAKIEGEAESEDDSAGDESEEDLHSSDEEDEDHKSVSSSNNEEDQVADEEGAPHLEEESRNGPFLESDTFRFIHSPQKLLNLFYQVAREAYSDEIPPEGGFVIGMVGYPNVGKSSTINRIFGVKKSSVSATPGKTKHFQTLVINERITLCDCPGLVMPQFGLSTSEMLLNGILPIAHMREHFSPVQLLCNRIPRQFVQQQYSVLLPRQQGPLPAHDLLTALAFLKGYMSASGIPDCSRSARLILSDLVDGRLKWVAAPPNMAQHQFDALTFAASNKSKAHQKAHNKRPVGTNLLEQLQQRELLLDRDEEEGPAVVGQQGVKGSRLDKSFFAANSDRRPVANGKKHWNKNKREKLRRKMVNNY